MSGSTWLSGQRDAFAVVLIIVATALYYRYSLLDAHIERTRLRLTIASLSGALFGMATLFRPTYAIFAVALAAVQLVALRRKALPYLLLLLFGGVLILGLSILPHLGVTGGLRELYLATIRFNLDVYATSGYSSPIQLLLHHRVELTCDIIMILWAAVRFFTKRESAYPDESLRRRLTRTDTALFIAYLVGARLSVIIMGKFFVQHYAMALMLSGFLVADILDRASALLPRLAQALPWVVACAIIGFLYTHNFTPYFLKGLVEGAFDPFDYAYRKHPHEPADKLLNTDVAVRYLEHRAVAGGRIECFGMTPAIYWRTHTASASRFSMMHPLVLEKPNGGITEYQSRWRKEFIDSIVSVRPRFILIGDSDQLVHSAAYYQHQIPHFDSILAADYRHDTTFPGWTIYRRLR